MADIIRAGGSVRIVVSPRSIDSTDIVDGRLIISYSDGTTQDAGPVGGGTPTPTPTPAPTFTVQPTISPSSGTAGSTAFTATPGTVSNGTITARAWLLNGTAISSTLTASPMAAGTLTYQETATGAGGTAQSAVQTVTVSAAPTPTPTPAAYLPDLTYAHVSGARKLMSTHTGPIMSACAVAAGDGTPATSVDVPYATDGTPDYTAAINAFGTKFAIWRAYDQTGAGGHATQLTAAKRAVVDTTLPFAPAYYQASSSAVDPGNQQGWLDLPQSVVTGRRNSAMFTIVSGSNGGQGGTGQTIMALGQTDVTAGASIVMNTQRTDAGGLGVRSNTEYFSFLPIDSYAPTLAGIVFGTSATTIVRDTDTATFAASTDVQMLGGRLGMGLNPVDNTLIRNHGHIVMATTPSTQNVQDIAAAVKAIYAIPTRTAQIVMDGDSIQRGVGSTVTRNKQLYLRALLSQPCYMRNVGIGGLAMSDLATQRVAGWFTAMFVGGLATNAYTLNAGTNDINGGRTLQNLKDDFTTLLNRAKAAGFTVFRETILPFSYSGDPTKEGIRNDFNQWCADNAASMGFTLIDYRGTTVELDSSGHPTNAGFQAMAQAAAPVLNTLFGPAPAPTLQTLTLATTTATAGAAYSSTFSGKTSGSTVTATSSDGTSLTVSGSTVTGTFAAAGSKTITLTETLAGATGSPKTSTGTVTVAAAATGVPVKAIRAEVTRTQQNAGVPSPAVGRFFSMQGCTPLDAGGAAIALPGGSTYSRAAGGELLITYDAPNEQVSAQYLFDNDAGTRAAGAVQDDKLIALLSYSVALPTGQTITPAAFRLQQTPGGDADIAWATFRIVGTKADGTEVTLAERTATSAIPWENGFATFPVTAS